MAFSCGYPHPGSGNRRRSTGIALTFSIFALSLHASPARADDADDDEPQQELPSDPELEADGDAGEAGDGAVVRGDHIFGLEEGAISDPYRASVTEHDLLRQDGRFRLLAAPGNLGGETPMRLAGFGFDMPVHRFVRLGFSGLRAVGGEMRGLYAGGFQGGLHTPIIGVLEAEATLFLGASGGPAQSRGLMVIPSAGLSIDISEIGAHVGAVGLQLARMIAPDADADGTNYLLFTVDLPWPSLSVPGVRHSLSTDAATSYGVAARSLRSLGHAYIPLGDQEVLDGTPLHPQGLAGIEYRMHFTEGIFGSVEARGAFMSPHAGYAEFTLGPGVSYGLFDLAELGDRRGSVWASAGLGGGGGGTVDTGPGLLMRGSVGLDFDLPGPAHIGADVGYVDAPRGDFRVLATGLRLGISEHVVRERPFGARVLQPGEEVALSSFRVRPAHRTVFGLAREPGDSELAHQLGLKFDYLIGDHVYLSGQAAGSYDADTSGFATGFGAIGASSSTANDVRVIGELGLGAAGGGNADVGYGVLLQPMAGANYALTRALGLEVLGGWSYAPFGEVSSPVVDASLIYTFSTPIVER